MKNDIKKEIAELKNKTMEFIERRGLKIKYNEKGAFTFIINPKQTAKFLTCIKPPYLKLSSSDLMKVGYSLGQQVYSFIIQAEEALKQGDNGKAWENMYWAQKLMPVFEKETLLADKHKKAGDNKKGKTKKSKYDNSNPEKVKNFMQGLLNEGKKYVNDVVPRTAKKFKIKQWKIRKDYPKKSFK